VAEGSRVRKTHISLITRTSGHGQGKGIPGGDLSQRLDLGWSGSIIKVFWIATLHVPAEKSVGKRRGDRAFFQKNSREHGEKFFTGKRLWS